MGTFLVRYAELGLKSEKVRARFLNQLLDSISNKLTSGGIDHVIETERGRIFIETDNIEEAPDYLKTIPGIFSFSVVKKAPSDMTGLMDAMAEYSKDKLEVGMSFGIKVKRTGNTPYSSRDVAIAGGDAVCRHLDDSKVSVDLRNPDIWFEVEIRGKKAYLFTERVIGMGGMPSDTQGKVLLFLPERKSLVDEIQVTALRTILSRQMMIRRGCRVIPVVRDEDLKDWEDVITELIEDGKDPFLIHLDDIEEGLMDAIKKTGARGVVHPGSEEDIPSVPFIHGRGFPAAVFMPTVSMDEGDLRKWSDRFG